MTDSDRSERNADVRSNRDAQVVHVVPPKPEAEVDDELRFHLEQRIRAYIASGMTPDAARR